MLRYLVHVLFSTWVGKPWPERRRWEWYIRTKVVYPTFESPVQVFMVRLAGIDSGSVGQNNLFLF